MRTLQLFKTILIIPFFLTFFTGSAQQDPRTISPCLCIDVEPRDCREIGTLDPNRSKIVSSNAVTLNITDDPRTLDETSARARYKVFWLPGDGNFFHQPLQNSTSDVATNTYEYTYHQTGDYTTVAHLTEKKSNDEPPRPTKRKITVNSLNRPQGSPFIKRLENTPRSADILNSEKLRIKYPTAFVVSSHKSSSDVLVYFFYNNQLDPSGNPVQRDNILQLEEVVVPSYSRDITYTSGKTRDLTSFAELRALESQFSDYIEFPIDQRALDNMAPGFDEFRFFPIIKTISADTLPVCRFAVVVVGNKAPGDSTDAFYNNNRMENLSGVLASLFPTFPELNDNFILHEIINADFGENFKSQARFIQNPDFNFYVTGAYYVDVPILASIDPNNIAIKSICPDGNGSYKVTAQLEVCNQGYVDETTIPIRIKDLHGLFSDFTILSTGDTINFENQQLFFTWDAHLDPIPHPSDVPGTYDELDFEKQCAQLDFSVKTNWEGVQKLVAGNGLEMCVTFLNATSLKEECNQNTPIYDADAATLQQAGYKCGPPEGGSCNIWCILAILLGLFFAFWWWWKSRND